MLGARLVFHPQTQSVTYGLSVGFPYPSISELLSKVVTLSPPWHPCIYLDIYVMAAQNQAQGLQLIEHVQRQGILLPLSLWSTPALLMDHFLCGCWARAALLPPRLLFLMPQSWSILQEKGNLNTTTEIFKHGKLSGHYIARPWLLSLEAPSPRTCQTLCMAGSAQQSVLFPLLILSTG